MTNLKKKILIYPEINGIFISQDEYIKDDQNHRFISDKKSGSYVYIEVLHKSTRKPAICKVINPRILYDEDTYVSPDQTQLATYQQQKLMREVINLKQLNHPTIVKFLGFNMYNNKITYYENTNTDLNLSTNPTIFLEYLEKGPLQYIVNNSKNIIPGCFDATKRQICMIGLASAIRVLHQKGIIHRGLNPMAIWLDANYYPKILDFSSSRIYNPSIDASMTMTDEAREIYQAPELRSETGTYRYNTSVDIFSLGRIFYIMVTGSEPYKLRGYEIAATRRFNAPLKFPNHISQDLIELIEVCCSNNPSERPSADEVYSILASDPYRFRINDNFEIKEIQDYVNSIEEFERQHDDSKRKLRYCDSFEIPEVDHDLSEDKQEQLLLLSKLIFTNFTYLPIEESLKLLKELAENGQILNSNYLNDVSSFINDASKNGHTLADEFLAKVYGEYVVPNGTKEILSKTIKDISITTANIPPSVTKIGKNAFKKFALLERVNIPNSVTCIEEGAFLDCKQLVTINIPDSIKDKKLGKAVFQGCSKLNCIYIPSTLKKISDKTFKNNKNLVKVVINEGVEEIGKNSFDGCQSLKSVIIPKTVKFIDEFAFANCPLLDALMLKGKTPNIKVSAVDWQIKNYL